jgi:hypothetical protein
MSLLVSVLLGYWILAVMIVSLAFSSSGKGKVVLVLN